MHPQYFLNSNQQVYFTDEKVNINEEDIREASPEKAPVLKVLASNYKVNESHILGSTIDHT
jgi:hypothetical protein